MNTSRILRFQLRRLHTPSSPSSRSLAPSFLSRARSSIFPLISLTLSTILLGHVFSEYFYTLRSTFGISMSPTIRPYGDLCLISRHYRRGRGITVGDIVSFKHPTLPYECAVKRVVGMPGDFVLVGTPGTEQVEGGDGRAGWMVQVPDGHCWVAGDNQEFSRDSRIFGPLPLALIKGKVIANVPFPPWRAHWYRNTLVEYNDFGELGDVN
ncbi:LexA/Signal peptidase [Lepidopterella palustris CBS 459.81]|uniref:LexA/Signal peptidase n=1 Tax=Lepidopterella palustris CBS 459.81 TaxID=1314670 RepID=A0A8E2EKJ0_9PEZI|nr:LexA/Signal peptidase [Lepidopterella palustris CBS 459.81]